MLRVYSIRFILIFVVLTALFTFAPMTSASPPTMPPWQGVLTNCTGEYFNNVTLTGSPVFTRTDASINFFWPENTSPAAGIPTNNYSVRWTCTINVTSDSNVTFTITTDDGMNVLVDNNLILWEFFDQGPTSYSATTYLAAGAHSVRVEYYNRWNAGTAIVSSTASPGPMPGPITPIPPSPGGGVLTNCTGEYFNNTTITGAPVLTRTDAALNFFWPENTSPAAGIPTNNYSVRWTCTINVTTTGNVTFTITTDDGMNVLVDGNLVLWEFFDQGPTSYSATTYLNAGAHTVRVEYYNRWNAGTAIVSSSASPGPMPGPITPFPPIPPSPTSAWYGQYYNNMTLSGSPMYVRTDPALNFNWGETLRPAPGVPHNYFSAKWDSTQNLPVTADYTITATSDDGVRVWVDGALVIDGWSNHPPITYTAVRTLAAGAHAFHVEYYNLDYGALIFFSITQGGVAPGPSPMGAWRGYYFNNISFSGAPAYVRDDSVINFNWGESALPAPGVPHNNFSVRWDSIQNIPVSRDYTISATSDDGVRVWVDGSLAVDGFFDHSPATFTTIRNLSAGAHSFSVEYYNRNLGAMVVVQIY